MTNKRGDEDPSLDSPNGPDSASTFTTPPQSNIHVTPADVPEALHWRRLAGFALVQASTDGVFATDTEFRVRTWSRGLERLTGHPAAHAHGQSVTDLLPVLQHGALEQVLSGRAVTVGPERWAIAATGQLGSFVVRCTPLKDEAQGLVGVLGLVRDVSELSELEERLLHTQKLDLTGRLAGGIAHDFNNLLTVIMGEVALALSAARDGSNVEDALREIRRCAEQATTLTRQLLTFARREQTSPVPFALAELVTDVGQLLKRLVGDDVELRTSLANERIYVSGDRAQLEQVLANLVVNARDALENGGRITIRTGHVVVLESHELARALPPGDYAELTVDDTGMGMSADVRARLFEPFFTTKDRGSGTGLGLYLSYDIVQKHGGHILVSSELGEGTQVRVLLPRIAPSVRSAPRIEVAAPAGSETILIVEPDDPVRHVTARALRALGYRVLEAHDAEDALRLAERPGIGIDLLLSAILLNGNDMLDLLARTRALFPDVAVLISSGYDAEFAERRGLVPHGAELLNKPYSPQILAKRVRSVLDARPVQER